MPNNKRIGVLALQGDFLEHAQALAKLGVGAVEVRLSQHLDGLDGLIIPGGESTTIAKLMDLYRIREYLKQRIDSGMALWGTCAGMILMARQLKEPDPEPLNVMDIEVSRNAYGRQVDSFEADVQVPALGEDAFHAVFIRAPKVTQVGDEIETLASLEEAGPIVIKQGKLLATAFHPELTEDLRLHSLFLRMAEDST